SGLLPVTGRVQISAAAIAVRHAFDRHVVALGEFLSIDGRSRSRSRYPRLRRSLISAVGGVHASSMHHLACALLWSAPSTGVRSSGLRGGLTLPSTGRT